MRALVLADQLLFANLFFNLIQRCDLFEGLLGTLRLVCMRLKEIEATVTPAQGVSDTDLLGVTVQGRRREAGSEGSVEQTHEPMDKNRIGGMPCGTSGLGTTKSISIKHMEM